MARVAFAWELGGGTGHVATLLPLARALMARGHAVRFFARDAEAGADLCTISGIPREPAPQWIGPAAYEDPLNFGEILHNFGYHDALALRALVDAWRNSLQGFDLVVANASPAAHLAARTLRLPSIEVSQGFHVPPATLPAPPLRDWEPVSRERLDQADGRVLAAMRTVLESFGAKKLNAIGELFSGRAVLLTYPELDIYPQRGPADYYGITQSAEGTDVPSWPAGRGLRVFAYLQKHYAGLPRLVEALESLGAPTLMLCRHADAELRARGGSVFFAEKPMSVSQLLPQCDVVVCHGSHQMTAQALLAGKPVLMLPTQLEQFLIARRVARHGAGLATLPQSNEVDLAAALAELGTSPRFAEQARAFAARYSVHSRDAALLSIVRRCEAALA